MRVSPVPNTRRPVLLIEPTGPDLRNSRPQSKSRGERGVLSSEGGNDPKKGSRTLK